MEDPSRLDNRVLVEEALRERPDEPALLHLAAVSHLGDDDASVSRSYARRAVERSRDPNVLTLCGRILFDRDDVEGATEAVRAVAALGLDEFGADLQYLYLGGSLALVENDDGRARELWEYVFEQDPEMPGLGYDLAVLYVDQREEVGAVLGVIDTALQHPHDHERLLALRAEIERALAEAGEA